jgi:nucleotide-binding universal stress UspA family protein
MKLGSILVAVDSVTGSIPIVRAAVELSRKSNAEVSAVFIEEMDWFTASRFKFSSQISGLTGEIRPFTELDIAEETKAHSELLKKLIVQFSSEYQVKHKFQSVRGYTRSSLLQLAENVDLFAVGRNRHPERSELKLGSNTRFFIENSIAPVLVWNNGPHWPRTLSAICMDAESSVKTIEWTLDLSRLLGVKPEFIWNTPLSARPDFEKLYNRLKKEMPGQAEKIMNASKPMKQFQQESHHLLNRVIVIDRQSAGVNEAQALVSRRRESALML